MEVYIYTSDSDEVDPKVVAEALALAGYFVGDVIVNDGERAWSLE